MAQLPLCAPVHVLITPARIATAESVEQRPRTPGECDLPRGLADAIDAPARNAVFLRSGALKPGIILPLSYETARFHGLAAVIRFTFLMTIVILSDR